MKKFKYPIWRASKSEIENLLRKEGFTNLLWASGGDFSGGISYWSKVRGENKTVSVGGALDACPPDYNGEIEDYRERIVIEVLSKEHRKHLGYSFTRKYGGPISFV
jgi:hypothetical protein